GGDSYLVWDAFKHNGAHNLVVIGAGARYNIVQSYLEDLPEGVYQPFDHIQVFLVSTQEQANSQLISQALRQPNTTVYFVGGDQTDYLDMLWGTNRNNSFLTTINRLFSRKQLSFGGSSAGLAVQGDRAFRGPVVNSTGSRLLLDPNNVNNDASFGRYVSFEDDFLHLLGPALARPVLTDTHFKERNRMARFVAFLAQTQTVLDLKADLRLRLSWNGRMHGIAVDEGTALIVDVNFGIGMVMTTVRRSTDLPGYVFFGEAQQGTQVQFPSGRLDTTKPVAIRRVGANYRFNLITWTPNNPVPSDLFKVQITDGRAYSEGLLLSRDLYYNLSYLDMRLLKKQDNNGELIL
ncbi:MAG TPA: hypothetical protein VKD72_32460, partial [Gemmataceae bacterium]|nr:hypothetical protein [Gemmataceae bacterium]